MTTDVHMHPIYFDVISSDDSKVKFREEKFGIHKQSPYPMEEILYEMDYAKIDKSILLPLDLTTIEGGEVVSNEEIKKIVAEVPERFIGFGSVDPSREDAIDQLLYIFDDLKLSGLNLHPGKQLFYPNESKMKKIYSICQEKNKPIMFHAGLSWEPQSYIKYGQPIHFEEIAIEYPDLRICLSHFCWPWIKETIMLLIKYPNVYTDTSMLYLNSFEDFFRELFTKEIDQLTIERNFPKQILFGSNTPRFRAFKMKQAIEKFIVKEDVRENLFSLNAEEFLYGKKGKQ